MSQFVKPDLLCLLPLLLLLQWANRPIMGAPNGQIEGHPHANGHSSSYSTKTFSDVFGHDDQPKSYILSIAIKFSNGCDILMIKDFDGKHYHADVVLSLEKVLPRSNGIRVKCIEDPEMKKAMRENDMNLFKAAQIKGGLIEFEEDVHQAVVITYDSEGKAKEEKPKTGPFIRKKGQKERIWDLLMAIREFDHRWYMPDRDHHDYQDCQVFDPLFDGHTMAALALPDGEDENGKEKLREAVRYHYNTDGLNVFVKSKGEKGENYVLEIDDHNQQHFMQKPVKVDRKLGEYLKGEFRPRLWSRPLTIAELSKIAFKVVNRQPWGGHCKCHNFVYEFVQAIVAEVDLEGLKDEKVWPECQTILNDIITEQDKGVDGREGRNGFEKSVLRFKEIEHIHKQQ